MMVPTNDLTWDLEVASEEDSTPPDNMDVATWQQSMDALNADAEARCDKMKRVISDQFGACNAPRVFRRCFRDACRIGTGLVMGPLNTLHVQRHFGNGQQGVKVTEKPIPEIR